MTQTFEVVIEKLIHGGAGLGHHHGAVVFVPGTAPGDVVRVREIRRTRDFIQAEPMEVLRPSEMRANPPCRLFGKCGGCQWQHIRYPFQLQAKEEIFCETLRRIALIDGYLLQTPLPTDQSLGYRKRVRMQVRGKSKVGFFRANSAEVVDIHQCPAASAGINRVLALIRGLLEKELRIPDIAEVEITEGEGGQIMLLFRTTLQTCGSDARFLGKKALQLDDVQIVSISSHGRRKALNSLPVLYSLSVDDSYMLKFRISPLAFIQPNYIANRALVGTVLHYASPDPSQFFLDLFCGAGNFSLPLACNAGAVIGVDQSIHAISSARLNARENHIQGVQFMCKSAHVALEELSLQDRCAHVIILDPPRSGARRVVERLIRFSPQRIVYVSCDPATLARDLKNLVASGYRMASSTLVDMFPHTSHIESVTLLLRE